ncbi:MAG: DUF4118 domain-containing protein [Oscillospiraceae bacterium]|nr:DUF4118 domain-containing protein [Oscillospiraceae bacterium]
MKRKRRSFRRFIKESLTFSWRDLGTTLIVLGAGFALCAVLQLISDTDFHVPLIFVLAVLLVSLFTDGYLFGLASSVISVVGVNFVFTYPYFHINFYMTGYPLTFLCMLVVSIISCTLMSRVRKGEQARLEAEREKMRANLLRAISHDFRTPLTSIIGTLEVLNSDDRLSHKDQRTLINDAKSDAEWLINIMENILSITRIGAEGTPKLHTEPQALEEVLGEAVVRFKKQYPDMPVKISVPDEFLMSDIDAMLIEQVIINLLINVVLHGKTATWARLSLVREGEMARVSVEDDGSGISQRALAHLFDGQNIHSPDDRSEDSRRTMGIGLSVCRTIIIAHGGSMKAENRSEGGACLSFTLPIMEADENGNTFEDIDS